MTKLARYLPEFRDDYFLRLQAAAHGAYKPREEEPEANPALPRLSAAAESLSSFMKAGFKKLKRR